MFRRGGVFNFIYNTDMVDQRHKDKKINDSLVCPTRKDDATFADETVVENATDDLLDAPKEATAPTMATKQDD